MYLGFFFVPVNSFFFWITLCLFSMYCLLGSSVLSMKVQNTVTVERVRPHFLILAAFLWKTLGPGFFGLQTKKYDGVCRQTRGCIRFLTENFPHLSKAIKTEVVTEVSFFISRHFFATLVEFYFREYVFFL